MTRELEQLAHDQRIGLAIQPVAIDRAGGAGLVAQRRPHRAAAGPVGPQERAIDVEENELHAWEKIARSHSEEWARKTLRLKLSVG